jgi:hypothetical protein
VDAGRGKVPAEKPALKPYWGKPAVRNFRGDDGNVGIIRSPVRAIALLDNPDWHEPLRFVAPVELDVSSVASANS